ncbi:MAG: Permease of the major facilitator superfamily [Candidatus Nomurabacteria bacterium GW2011_GWB1_37_5]|uniref:Permease of the major facilitator superfamily n=1 Tax=Candidatus Nomurabacteria bacterium GW2011_GWB1_37_5 TaxID=1618742 RepID=A0A0G0K5V4_9BACT|nr:MAG: Permease of the major facilitator superfamily [Candidatus Nomurabacteria bacterium GW2011_GWB1_37_5]
MESKKKEKILLIGAGFWWLGEGLFGPLFAIFAGRVGGDIFEITWAWATYLLVTGIFAIFMGKLADRFGKERLMVLGYALNAIFTWSYLLVHSATGLFIVQAGLGLSLALADPTWDALYSKYEDKKHAGYAWGISHGIEQIITGISILIGGLIVASYSFTALFVIMGTIQTIGTIYQAKILRHRVEKSKPV